MLDGSPYCYSCAQEELKAKKQLEFEKKELYEEIKKTFLISECPPLVIRQIDKLLEQGKKIPGIKLTIRYYYGILNNVPNDVNNLIFIIKDNYDLAKEYYKKQQELKKINMQIEINVPKQVVKIKKPAAKPHKFNYKMEDL